MTMEIGQSMMPPAYAHVSLLLVALTLCALMVCTARGTGVADNEASAHVKLLLLMVRARPQVCYLLCSIARDRIQLRKVRSADNI